jgi:hypothetical protein
LSTVVKGYWNKLSDLLDQHRDGMEKTGGVLGIIGLLGGVALGTTMIVLLTLMQGVVLSVVALTAFAGIYLLRGCDTVMLWFRGIRITCPACYRHGFYPSYECNNCAARHHDVRPGRYGVVRRVCACHARLPTLLLLGSHRMKAFCAHCEAPLAEQVGTASEVILPVFGAGGAGKTRLMIVIMMAVEEMAGRTGAKVRPADDETRIWDSKARDEMVRIDKVAKTIVGRLPRAYSLHVEPRRGPRRLVHVFDPAGEFFHQSDRVQELQYLRLARTFLFVVDPLSIDKLWNSLSPADQSRHHSLRAAREPEFVFAQTVQNIEAMGVDTRKARLAAVVSKADLVREILTEHGVGNNDADIARWLEEELAQGNMLRAMRHAFAEVRLFLTTAVVEDGKVDGSIEDLTGWVLSKHDLKLVG